ncbi:hypothetical protein AGMMS50218_00140 [Actinomycetota bacterium]|nr:hypothetical protein AGMMS50218_00140 [Actinomycetota bacterium]
MVYQEVVAVAMTKDRHEAVAAVRRDRVRSELARLDYLRGLAAAAGAGASQRELARELHVTQPSVSSALKTARTTPSVPAGFHGASPYEIAERFLAGEITRAQVIEELARWPYRPVDAGDGFDWSTYAPGEFEEVGRALTDGLLDDAIYDAILDRRDELAR